LLFLDQHWFFYEETETADNCFLVERRVRDYIRDDLAWGLTGFPVEWRDVPDLIDDFDAAFANACISVSRVQDERLNDILEAIVNSLRRRQLLNKLQNNFDSNQVDLDIVVVEGRLEQRWALS